MKSIVIILGLLCAVLGFAVYKQASAKHVEAEQLAKECATLSNKVAELTTRMTLTAATNDIAVSNLVSLADRRTAEVHNLSNRLVQTRLLLRATQTDLHTNQTALQQKAAELAVLQAEYDDVAGRLVMLPSLESKLATARQQYAALQETVTEQKREQQKLQFELAQLQNKLENVPFLRTQLARAEDDAEVRRRTAATGRYPAASDRRIRLEMRPDGTVRAVPVE